MGAHARRVGGGVRPAGAQRFSVSLSETLGSLVIIFQNETLQVTNLTHNISKYTVIDKCWSLFPGYYGSCCDEVLQ